MQNLLRRVPAPVHMKEKRSKNGGTFYKNALLIAFGSFFAKVIGAVYRLPLSKVLGGYGLGLYQMVFPVYGAALTVSASGVPTAVSKLVAEEEEGKKENVLAAALSFLPFAGLVLTALLLCLSKPLSVLQGNAAAARCYRAIAPAIFFTSAFSAIRGYFQGRNKMFPTAASQIVEQTVKLCAGLLFAAKWKTDPARAAAGACLGVSVSEAFACLYLFLRFFRERPAKTLLQSRGGSRMRKKVFRALLPMIVIGILPPLTSVLTGFFTIPVLSAYETDATALYGVYFGGVTAVTGVPVALCYGVAVAALPVLSKKIAGRRKESVPVTPYGLPADEPYAKVAETSVKVGAGKETWDKPHAAGKETGEKPGAGEETGDKPGAGKAEKSGRVYQKTGNVSQKSVQSAAKRANLTELAAETDATRLSVEKAHTAANKAISAPENAAGHTAAAKDRLTVSAGQADGSAEKTLAGRTTAEQTTKKTTAQNKAAVPDKVPAQDKSAVHETTSVSSLTEKAAVPQTTSDAKTSGSKTSGSKTTSVHSLAENAEKSKKLVSALLFTLFIAFPGGAFCYFFRKELIGVLFSTLKSVEKSAAATLLGISAFSVPVAALGQTASAALIAGGRSRRSALNLGFGCVTEAALSFLLLKGGAGIFSLAISALAGNFVATFLNLLYIRKDRAPGKTSRFPAGTALGLLCAALFAVALGKKIAPHGRIALSLGVGLLCSGAIYPALSGAVFLIGETLRKRRKLP